MTPERSKTHAEMGATDSERLAYASAQWALWLQRADSFERELLDTRDRLCVERSLHQCAEGEKFAAFGVAIVLALILAFVVGYKAAGFDQVRQSDVTLHGSGGLTSPR